MNLAGRILVVLIFSMSIIFMGFSMAIYSSQTNWKDEAAKLQTEVRERRARNEELETERDALNSAYELARTTHREQLAKLEVHRHLLQGQLERLRGDLATNSMLKGNLNNEVSRTQNELSQLIQAVQGLRDNVNQERQTRDSGFDEFTNRFDIMNQAATDLQILEERFRQLQDDVAFYEGRAAP